MFLGVLEPINDLWKEQKDFFCVANYLSTIVQLAI